MDNKYNEFNGLGPNNSSGENNQKKEYRTPKIHRHGGLAELVQLRPDRGRDGETRWVDCTSG